MPMKCSTDMGHIQKIHFIGVGGVGMAGIAEVLLALGYEVSGTDIHENYLITRLQLLGAKIFIGHNKKHVKDVDVIVVSSAIQADNPELTAAKKSHIPVVPRAEMLGELMRFRYGIAIAGTHGKTSTTSLIASLLSGAGLDPTFVIGGKLNSIDTNARLGKGHYLVAEADESDASFLHLNPIISVVTNIDFDHMETYNNSKECQKETFIQFLQRLPFYGKAIVCNDNAAVREIIPKLSRSVLTYGVRQQDSDYYAYDVEQNGIQTNFKVRRPYGLADLKICLNIPGLHNVQNALAAIAVAAEVDIADKYVVRGLKEFSGVGRRFDIKGDFKLGEHQVTLVDDYGHHPREVELTIETARKIWPDKHIIMLFQPHRYTRTKNEFARFCEVLPLVDELLLLEEFSAGESYIKDADSAALFAALKKGGMKRAHLINDHTDIPRVLTDVLSDNAVLITQGAGNISAISTALMTTELSQV